MINIILFEPEIAGNTGNIGRTCVATNTHLHLIEPLGFRLSQREIKRSGMDYWNELQVTRYINFDEFLEKNPHAYVYPVETRMSRCYTDVRYEEDCYILFGKESTGIPKEILKRYQNSCIRIPMKVGARSLNLSNSVSIVLYEVLRQRAFEGLQG